MKNKVFKIKLKVGDNVVVRAGKYKGKTGKITAVYPRLNAVDVEGINIFKKHMKPSKEYPQGDIIKTTKPMNVSKLSILEPIKSKATRVGYTIESGKKIRIYRSTGKEIK